MAKSGNGRNFSAESDPEKNWYFKRRWSDPDLKDRVDRQVKEHRKALKKGRGRSR